MRETFINMDKPDLTPTTPKKKFTIETIEIAGYVSALMALRLPFGLGCRSIGSVAEKHSISEQGGHIDVSSVMNIEPKDLHLLSTLVKRGDEHSKCLRGLLVYTEINAPRYFWQEMVTYEIGAIKLSSESTMHIQGKGMSTEELVKMKSELLSV